MKDSLRWDREHVVWPKLVRVEGEDGAFGVYIPGHGTSLEVEEESSALVEQVLAGFSQAITLSAFRAQQPDVPYELLALLVRSCFIVEVEELAFLEHGFLRPAPGPIGAPCSWSDLPDLAEDPRWVVLGVPVDMVAGGAGGARHGPSEIRKVVNGELLTGQGDVVDHELGRLYPGLALAHCDLGDVDPDGGRMDHVGQRLAKVTREPAIALSSASDDGTCRAALRAGFWRFLPKPTDPGFLCTEVATLGLVHSKRGGRQLK